MQHFAGGLVAVQYFVVDLLVETLVSTLVLNVVVVDVELITPIAMDKELRFAIREGGHTVGAGVVTEIAA